MHLGHGRWAAIGDSLARVFKSAGFVVEKEFYINDYGTQMDILGRSVSIRYLQLLRKDIPFPDDGYKGKYISMSAKQIVDSDGSKYLEMEDEEREELFKERTCKEYLNDMKNTLDKMKVEFNVWFSESSLHHSKELDNTLEELKQKNLIYQRDGATWLKTTKFSDDKDRVLIRESGEPTYFYSDVAYHHNKFNRGFNKVINIWGADHHGYIKRMKAAVQALGYSSDSLEVIIGQLVNLLRGGEPVRMSKRTGEMVTLDELIDEVGVDAVRYFFTMRSTDTPLDFDIELAKEESQNNPVYYVQYAYARICSILKFGKEKGFNPEELEKADLSLIKEDSEFALIKKLAELEDLIEKIVEKKSPYLLCSYIEEVANLFHIFYTKCRVITEDRELSQARLALICAVKVVISNVLSLIGVTAPQSM